MVAPHDPRSCPHCPGRRLRVKTCVAMEMLGMTRSQVLRLISKGKLDATKLGNELLVSTESIRKYRDDLRLQ